MLAPAQLRGCPVTITLIALNVLLYAGQLLSQQYLTSLGMLFGPSVRSGEIWRLLSSGFLHGSLLHIAFNMYLLFMLGPMLEKPFGSLRFVLMYFGALFGGALAVMVFDWDQRTLGASAAVLGLASCLGVALYERGIKPQQSPMFGLVVLNLALPLLVPGISFWGHFGGVLAGILMGYLLAWLPRRSTAGLRVNTLPVGAAAVLAVAVLSLAAAYAGGI